MKPTNTIVFLLMLCIVFSTTVSAQQNKLEMGIDAGAGASFLLVEPQVRSYIDPMLCYSTGLFVNYNINKHLALKTGIYNDLRGYTNRFEFSDYAGVTTPVELKTSFQYLTIPILAKLSFGNKTRFFTNAGPYLSYMLSARYKDDKNIMPLPEKNQAQNHYRINAGLILGLGVSHTLKEKYILSLELRDTIGLLGVGNISTNYPKTNTINLLLGFAWKML